jgi:ABC-type multidrug transport system fused ATPase/permease subunit
MSDVPNLTGLFSTVILGGLSGVIALVAGGVVMFRLDPHLALAAAAGPPFVAAAAAIITRPLRPASRRVQVKVAELTERLQENLTGLREIVAFAREHRQELRFAATMRELLRLRMRLAALDLTIGSGAGLVSLAVTLTILVYGAYLTIGGQTTLGTVLAMRSLFGLLFQPAGQLVGLVASAQKSLASAERIYAFLDEEPGVEDDPAAIDPGAVAGEVTFEGVGFAYHPGQPVLREVSFTARPGELIALVGPSGAGKSTLVSLIARFYDPDAGRILLDGVDLRDLRLAGVRERIGIVFQDTFLFSATIRENLAFGREGASEAEIVAAARGANAWEFIARLPEGLDTAVGERGARFSEGQKQRLAIARALLRDPRILILDEPTAALDARSEYLLNEALRNLMRGRTTFVIAHRLATAQRADRIIVLSDGGIVEQGTHAELLARGGLYRELCDLQFGGAGECPDTGHATPYRRALGAARLVAVAPDHP